MTRYPSCTWKPITGTSTRPVQKDILCLHTMVGYLSSTWSYFNRPDVGVYSHIGVGGPWGTDAGKNLDGVAWQMADTDVRGAANLNGNWHVISVETADNAARPIAPWTPAQCDRLVRIMVDANRLDGIPLTLIPDTRPGRRGVAYHRLGCDPWRVDGGELWSSSPGKDCPTQARIDQIPGLIDRARRIVAGQPEEDVMTPEQMAELKQYTHDQLQALLLAVLKGGANGTFPKGLPAGEVSAVQQVEDKVDGVRNAVDDLAEVVEERLPAAPGPTPA